VLTINNPDAPQHPQVPQAHQEDPWQVWPALLQKRGSELQDSQGGDRGWVAVVALAWGRAQLR